MIYLESAIQSDKLEMNYDLSFGLQMYDESLNDITSFFNKLKNMLFGYINQKKKIHEYYIERSHMKKKLKAINKLCQNKKIANTKIVIRSYNDKLFKSTDINEQIQFAKNMFSGVDTKLNNPELYKFFTGYIDDRSSWDKIYEIKIKDIPSFFEMSIHNLDKIISTLESNVNDFSRYVDYQETTNASKRNIFTFFKSIKSSIKKRFDIIDMNFEIVQFKINQVLHEDLEDELHKYVKEPSIKKQVSSAHKVDEITYGDTTYNIYQTEYPNTSCFNYGGLDIYLDKAFFNLPKGYQLAILYHEIGHHQSGHFRPKGGLRKANLTVEDEAAIMKRIKKDMNSFIASSTFNSKFGPKAYTDGSELAYLLLEWDADRFAADNVVGKHIMGSALTDRFKRQFDIMWKDPTEDQKLTTDFNLDRMHLRTLNI